MKVRILLIFIKSRDMGIGRGNVVGGSSGSPVLQVLAHNNHSEGLVMMPGVCG